MLDSRVPGPDLTELGRRQAAAIPGALAGRKVSSVTVSNMIRTSQTARPLAESRSLDMRVDEDLREIEAGDLEMASGAQALEQYFNVVLPWSRGHLDPRMPGGQDGHEFFERFDRAIERVVADGGAEPVIVSHAASIRIWVGCRCQNVDADFAEASDMYNTGSELLDLNAAGRWELLEWNAMPLGGAELHAKSGPEPNDQVGIGDPTAGSAGPTTGR